MQTYIGSKLVTALPMTQGAFATYLGAEQPCYEAPKTLGFMIEDPKGVSNHVDHAGQISWLPSLNFASEYLGLGDIQHRPNHVQRMIGELAQLEQKLDGLKAYMRSDLFLKLVFKDRDLMQEQSRLMSRYALILEERIRSS